MMLARLKGVLLRCLDVPSGSAQGTQGASRAAEAAQTYAAPSPSPIALAPPASARIVAADGAALITTGLLNHRLGITLTTAFIKGLGFQPVPQPRAGAWWRESDLKPINAALIEFLRTRNF